MASKKLTAKQKLVAAFKKEEPVEEVTVTEELTVEEVEEVEAVIEVKVVEPVKKKEEPVFSLKFLDVFKDGGIQVVKTEGRVMKMKTELPGPYIRRGEDKEGTEYAAFQAKSGQIIKCSYRVMVAVKQSGAVLENQ